MKTKSERRRASRKKKERKMRMRNSGLRKKEMPMFIGQVGQGGQSSYMNPEMAEDKRNKWRQCLEWGYDELQQLHLPLHDGEVSMNTNDVDITSEEDVRQFIRDNAAVWVKQGK